MSVTICGHCGKVNCVCLARPNSNRPPVPPRDNPTNPDRKAGFDLGETMIETGMFTFPARREDR